MKKWTVEVCQPMWQQVEVEANTEEDAERIALKEFDLLQAGEGERYVSELTEENYLQEGANHA